MWKKIGIDGGSRRKNIQTGQAIGEPMEDFQTGRTIGSGGWCKKNFQTGQTKQIELNRKKMASQNLLSFVNNIGKKLRSRQGNTSSTIVNKSLEKYLEVFWRFPCQLKEEMDPASSKLLTI